MSLQPSPPDNQVLTVAQFTRAVKQTLESRFPEVWIRGEISNLRRQASGHLYFSLKDADSQVSAVLFRGDAARLTTPLRDGMQVVAFGRVSVYEPRGNYQLILRVIVEDGVGRLQQQFEALKRKLADEGLFAPERKRELPAFARTIGFVTSPTGAAIRDFISILQRREWHGRLIVLPARVQGNEAAAEIVEMIEAANDNALCDLLVVGRGGGSLEDLWPFNEEIVVRAVAASRIPTISAVGHEIDFTLSDFAADFRAETPSAAAERISSLFLQTLERLEDAGETLADITGLRIERLQTRLERLGARLREQSPRNRLEQAFLRVDDLTSRLFSAARHDLSRRTDRLSRLGHRLAEASPKVRVSIARERLRQLRRRFESASPERVLHRGYALVMDDKGGVVTSAGEARQAVHLKNRFRDGEVPVRVDLQMEQSELPLSES